MKHYYIISLKWTSKGDGFITFWRSNARRYTTYFANAGIYREDSLDLMTDRDSRVAVVCEQVAEMVIKAEEEGALIPRLPNTKAVRKVLNLDYSKMREKKFATC